MLCRYSLTIILFSVLVLARGQRVEIQQLVFDGGGCPDFVTADPDLRVRISKAVVKGLEANVGVDDVVFRSPDRLTFRHSGAGGLRPANIKNEVRLVKNGEAEFFASVVCFFKTASVTTQGGVETFNINLRTKVLVLDRRGKKAYKNSSSIPAKIDPFCESISDTWITKEDFEQLLMMGVNDAFLKRSPQRQRLLLRCGRSLQLTERLARLDSFEVHKQRKHISAISADSSFYRLRMDLGGVDPEFTQSFFGLDFSEKLKQKGNLVDETNGQRYDLVVSIAAKENRLDTAADMTDPAVTYFQDEKLITQFHLKPTGTLTGVWGGHKLEVAADRDGLINYYIDNQWVALSQYFIPRRSKNGKYTVDAFFHEKDLPHPFREYLVHGLLAYELGQVIAAIAEQD